MTLMIQRGSERVSREGLAGVETPSPTKTWTPVPHLRIVELAEESLAACGLSVTSHDFCVWKAGMRFFGVLTIGGEASDYSVTVGLRNSHDMAITAAMAIGTRVLVCDNLAFSSEVVIKTRHTAKIMERLPGVVHSGIAKLVEARKEQDRRISLYKTSAISGNQHLHDLVIRLYRASAIPSTAIARVLEEYESPSYPEFGDQTLWSLMNATTEVLKNFGEIQSRTQRMHSVLDSEIAAQLLAV